MKLFTVLTEQTVQFVSQKTGEMSCGVTCRWLPWRAAYPPEFRTGEGEASGPLAESTRVFESSV